MERVVELEWGRVEVIVIVVRGHDVHDYENGHLGCCVYGCGCGCRGCGCGHVGGHGCDGGYVLDFSYETVIEYVDYVDCAGLVDSLCDWFVDVWTIHTCTGDGLVVVNRQQVWEQQGQKHVVHVWVQDDDAGGLTTMIALLASWRCCWTDSLFFLKALTLLSKVLIVALASTDSRCRTAFISVLACSASRKRLTFL